MSSSDVRCPLPTKVACASTEQSRLLSLGSRFLLKERGTESPSHEVIDTHFHPLYQREYHLPPFLQPCRSGPRASIPDRRAGAWAWGTVRGDLLVNPPTRPGKTAEYLGQLRSFLSAKISLRWKVSMSLILWDDTWPIEHGRRTVGCFGKTLKRQSPGSCQIAAP